MTQKTICINGKDVTFKSSAAIPRLYRVRFGRDIFKDISKLQGAIPENGDIAIENLEIFENVAYIMALHADPSTPDSIGDWLDQFEMFSIYEILPEILELWGDNLITTAKAGKKESPAPER